MKESAQIHTSGGPCRSRSSRRRRPRRSVVGANAGIDRRWSMPAVAFASRATGPSRIIRLATGATGAASAAHVGSRPSR